MDGAHPTQAYLALANELFEGRIAEDDLQPFTAQLPPLDNNLLDKLAQHAEETAQTQPRLGWAIVRVADATTREQGASLFIRSLSAFYLARAANHWAQPKRVAEAIERAHQGFENLNKPGWMAACDWQANALAWTKPDIVKAADTLEKALEGMIATGMDEFVPHCHLSLAFAQILVERFLDALEIIHTSEKIFAARDDIVNQARCWFTEASCLRRQSHFELATEKLEQAMRVFQGENSPIDIAHTNSQLALIHLLRTDNLSVAISYFDQAAHIFSEHNLDLYQAACMTYLGSIYMQYGRFEEADRNYQNARVKFVNHDVLGLLADNLNDSGKLNSLRGMLQTSVEQYLKANEIYGQLGMNLRAASTMANLGEVYGQLGRYQDALHYLEQAINQLKPFNNYLRLGTCEKYTAVIWSHLGQYEFGHEHLDLATRYYERSEQVALLTTIFNSRAWIDFRQGEVESAIINLKKSLALANKNKLHPQAALAQRLLGEVLLHNKQYSEAKQNLEEAYSAFTKMGMALEQAACLVALGTYNIEISKSIKAETAFKEALRISDGTFPEIDWRAYAGLAKLADSQGDTSDAIQAYLQGMKALANIRHNFWQPALAGSYLQTPASFFTMAISLAAEIGNTKGTLQFIESGKATTLIQQLVSNIHAGDRSTQELNDLRGEIDWLQEQLRVSFDQTNPLQSAIQTRRMRVRLSERATQYDALLAKLERQSHAKPATYGLPPEFELSRFRALANRVLGNNWVALDYYLAEDRLVIITITPDNCLSQISPISSRIRMALDTCHKTYLDTTPLIERDLAILGDWLIPTSLAQGLSPETILLLSPHQKLHGIPWASLHPGFAAQPLVTLCTPSIMPSLHSLSFLWDKAASKNQPLSNQGLVIGLSRFPNARKELPAVEDEIRTLKTTVGTNAKYLLEHEATWENLQLLCSQNTTDGLSRFAWLHFASHASADLRGGRLSGLSLWDGDIRLDQLRDLAPLPELVTFSACSGNYSYVYEGDEHMGLPTTCFLSGANSVVGSTRPISDHAATKFTIAFYRHHLEGCSAAQAVAQAQRQMIKNQEETTSWANFTCMGIS